MEMLSNSKVYTTVQKIGCKIVLNESNIFIKLGCIKYSQKWR